MQQVQEFVTFKNTCYLLSTFVAIKLLSSIIRNKNISNVQNRYLKKAKSHRAKRDQIAKNLLNIKESIPKDLEQIILKSSISQIKDLLDKQLITSVQLLNFYTIRTAKIGIDHNLVTEFNYQSALEQAQNCDNIRKQNPGLARGELFGIVMTVKDSFDVKGLPSSVGLVNRLDKIFEDDGFIVKVLRNAGAIIFAKTNVPQMLMSCEVDNFIYGQGQNPWNKERSCGGSTGGGGGLVASGCSPLELGSDIGGSIRIPSHFNGVTGFKPSKTRIPEKGHTEMCDAFSGQKTIAGCIGPIGKYVDDCTLFTRSVLNEDNRKDIPKYQHPPHFQFSPLNEEMLKTNKKMKIGYFKSLVGIPSAPAIQRAVDETVANLSRKGHELVEIELPDQQTVETLFAQILFVDGGKSFQELLKGEKEISLYTQVISFNNMPPFLQNALANFLGLVGEKRTSQFLKLIKPATSYDYQVAIGKMFKKREEYIKFFENQNLDAILSPTFGIPAGYHGFSTSLSHNFQYTSIWNALDFPAGSVPVTVVKDGENTYTDQFNDTITKDSKKLMQNSEGLPIGVQVISLPYKEEICLNIMKQIEELAKFHQQHKLPQNS